MGMFVRVARPMSGQVDGVDLSRFEPGRIYKLGHEHAAFVIAIGAGEPVDADADAANRLLQGIHRKRPPPQRFIGRERRSEPRN